jgi:hypothetical protein
MYIGIGSSIMHVAYSDVLPVLALALQAAGHHWFWQGNSATAP